MKSCAFRGRVLPILLVAPLAGSAAALPSLTIFTDVTSDFDAPFDPGEDFVASSNGALNEGDITFAVSALPPNLLAPPSPAASFRNTSGGRELLLGGVSVDIGFNDVPGLFSFDFTYQDGGRTRLALNGNDVTVNGSLSELLGITATSGGDFSGTFGGVPFELLDLDLDFGSGDESGFAVFGSETDPLPLTGIAVGGDTLGLGFLGAGPVPEPATGAFVLAGVALLTRRRRPRPRMA